MQLYITDIRSVNGDGTAGDIIEAGQQAADGRFPGTGRADKSNGLPGIDLQADLIQHRPVCLITEAYVIKGNIAAQRACINGPRLVGDVRLCINNFKITLEAGNTLRITLDNGIDLLDRPEEDIGQ